MDRRRRSKAYKFAVSEQIRRDRFLQDSKKSQEWYKKGSDLIGTYQSRNPDWTEDEARKVGTLYFMFQDIGAVPVDGGLRSVANASEVNKYTEIIDRWNIICASEEERFEELDLNEVQRLVEADAVRKMHADANQWLRTNPPEDCDSSSNEEESDMEEVSAT